MSVNRRRFLKKSLWGMTATLGAPVSGILQKFDRSDDTEPVAPEGLVIDTNVHISEWPFRDLKYSETSAMVDKLRKHGIREAWTGSYDALFHKNIDSVNARLAEACQQEGEGLLVPFGTVNPRWPDWKEDLRRCDEAYGMPGIRLYPGYQNYTLELPEFAELLKEASGRGMVVQIAIDQEDERMQHPRVEIPAVDVSPLPAVLESVPDVTVQLLNPFRHVRGDNLESVIKETDVLFDISNLDGNGGLERIMAGNHWYLGSTPIPSARLLMGSHVPFRPVENVLFKLMESALDEEDAAAIMSGNAARMLRTA
ncbi:hypothetical protein SAMN05443144_105111 [Fodinibius roseus]|uniref:Amidohydrolase-related domain-containing protein n=1 Tax=Fodinibius roseus TaxID=1194090 RepID=A0A1M4YNU2_9BACT|nr:hypothetical protein [Fodinibius roseus]SHF07172.1 hypothetical protein SAMN05443144_105111 [Fodinibius roseus]